MAILTEEAIRAWRAAHPDLPERIVKDGSRRFFAALGPGRAPAPAEIQRAEAAAREAVFAALTADAVLRGLPQAPPDGASAEALRGSLMALSPALHLPPPAVIRGLAPKRLAVGAALGALLGMLVLGTLLRWTLDLRDLGMLIGAPAGAAAAVLGAGRLAESAALRRTLTVALGAAGLVDLAATAALGFGGLWLRLAGMGLVRRIAVYAGLATLLFFTRESAGYDAGTYRDLVEERIRRWVECASRLLACLSLRAAPRTASEGPGLDPGLARAIQDLHASSLPNLPAAAEAVLLEGQRLGLEGLVGSAHFNAPEGSPEPERLRWGPELAARYRPFGLIEEGETVIVEDEPVIRDGVVLEKGRVRKQRA